MTNEVSKNRLWQSRVLSSTAVMNSLKADPAIWEVDPRVLGSKDCAYIAENLSLVVNGEVRLARPCVSWGETLLGNYVRSVAHVAKNFGDGQVIAIHSLAPKVEIVRYLMSSKGTVKVCYMEIDGNQLSESDKSDIANYFPGRVVGYRPFLWNSSLRNIESVSVWLVPYGVYLVPGVIASDLARHLLDTMSVKSFACGVSIDSRACGVGDGVIKVSPRSRHVDSAADYANLITTIFPYPTISVGAVCDGGVPGMDKFKVKRMDGKGNQASGDCRLPSSVVSLSTASLIMLEVPKPKGVVLRVPDVKTLFKKCLGIGDPIEPVQVSDDDMVPLVCQIDPSSDAHVKLSHLSGCERFGYFVPMGIPLLFTIKHSRMYVEGYETGMCYNTGNEAIPCFNIEAMSSEGKIWLLDVLDMPKSHTVRWQSWRQFNLVAAARVLANHGVGAEIATVTKYSSDDPAYYYCRFDDAFNTIRFMSALVVRDDQTFERWVYTTRRKFVLKPSDVPKLLTRLVVYSKLMGVNFHIEKPAFCHNSVTFSWVDGFHDCYVTFGVHDGIRTTVDVVVHYLDDLLELVIEGRGLGNLIPRVNGSPQEYVLKDVRAIRPSAYTIRDELSSMTGSYNMCEMSSLQHRYHSYVGSGDPCMPEYLKFFANEKFDLPTISLEPRLCDVSSAYCEYDLLLDAGPRTLMRGEIVRFRHLGLLTSTCDPDMLDRVCHSLRCTMKGVGIPQNLLRDSLVFLENLESVVKWYMSSYWPVGLFNVNIIQDFYFLARLCGLPQLDV